MKSKAVVLLAIVGLLAFAQTLSAQEKEKKKGRGGTRGVVKSVDAAGSKITVAIRERGKDEATDKTFKLAKEVKVTAGEDAKTLADVKEGSVVTLTVTNDEVTAIRIGMRRKKDNT